MNQYSTKQDTNKRKSKDLVDCPSCGSEMIFDPDVCNLRCLSCGKLVNINVGNKSPKEYNFFDAQYYRNKNCDVKEVTIRCENCGGETIVKSNDKTQFCAFCGSQQLIEIEDEQLEIAPENLVPFQISVKDAEEKFKVWLNKRILIPRKLKLSFGKDKIIGMYVPYWTYDVILDTEYNTIHFDDLLVCGLNDMSKLISKVEPYNMTGLVEYKPEFLAGYYAKKYDVSLEDGLEKAKFKMKKIIKRGFCKDIYGNLINYNYTRASLSNIMFKHILLPIYMSTYKYNGKVYNFIINGQTGRVRGETPKSPIKLTVLGLGIAFVMYLIYRLIIFSFYYFIMS